jgi:arachidonate 15-lipoxygenase
MSTTVAVPTAPVLPQNESAEGRAARAFELAFARTEYNYMRSYLDAVPMSADLPGAEKFSLDYEAQVVKVFVPLVENFKAVVGMLLQRELAGDLPAETLSEIRASWDKLDHEFSLLHPLRDAKDLRAFLQALGQLPAALENLVNLPRDVSAMLTGLERMFKEMLATGPTAFLKSTLYDMLSTPHGRQYLHARTVEDYAALYPVMPTPSALTIERQPWMPAEGLPCEQDWFFGQLQVAGFNTTQLRGVVNERGDAGQAFVLSELLEKFPVSDAILQRVSGDANATLAQAARDGRLCAVDYAQLEGARTEPLHGEARYVTAPIALFYWNPSPPPGFPPQGALQPIAIQLGQRFDPESTPIFTPGDRADANDPDGLKWRLAKYVVNVVCAIQHESVAHLGDTHLIIEPMIVATHRQLARNHPLHKLLLPHFRFTININDDAIHSLIVPGGVVACNVGIAIESSLELVTRAHQAWRWDQNRPDRVFALRGVDRLPAFAFRDDTLLLWRATHDFVSAYLRVYYRDDAAVGADQELQGWIHELTAAQYCGFQGLEGLVPSGDAQRPWRIESLDYLIEMVALILYTAGPQHASVNYAQYPLMSFVPSVTGSIYQPMPTRSTTLASEAELLAWYPPLDIALYGACFEFLLSAVQYDTYGRYEHNPRDPYFTDPRVQPLVADFQDALALIEIQIRARNQERALPYPFQLPSQIPNSISI